jgi:hypothetical protein
MWFPTAAYEGSRSVMAFNDAEFDRRLLGWYLGRRLDLVDCDYGGRWYGSRLF